jgi:hypothetical protein
LPLLPLRNSLLYLLFLRFETLPLFNFQKLKRRLLQTGFQYETIEQKTAMRERKPFAPDATSIRQSGRFALHESQAAWEHRFNSLYRVIVGNGMVRDDALAMRTGLFPCSNCLFWTHHPTLRREMELSKAQLNKRLAQISTVVPCPSNDAQGQLFVALNTALQFSRPSAGIRDWVLRRGTLSWDPLSRRDLTLIGHCLIRMPTRRPDWPTFTRDPVKSNPLQGCLTHDPFVWRHGIVTELCESPKARMELNRNGLESADVPADIKG